MLGIELLKGQGLGNQLFCYVTTRCIALERDYDFSVLGRETLGNNIHSDCGLYFMNLDMGLESEASEYTRIYQEREDRLYLPNSKHDLIHGCYVTGTDQELLHIQDQVLVAGNMQAEEYFIKYKNQIKQWLAVKPEYECFDYSRDNLCILHLRCTDYMDSPELFLKKKYWLNGMKNMRKIRPDMEFMIITNDTKEAEKIISGVKAYNFNLAKDYSIIKNAKHLLLANSSFTYFPAFTSDTVQTIIAPKYWARHNVSDGYWASEQNIYEGWTYQDRQGRLFSAEECRQELEAYKRSSAKYKKLNQKSIGISLKMGLLLCSIRFQFYYFLRLYRGLLRKCRRLFQNNIKKK